MNISVVGCGYVGMATAVGFAAKGHEVTCVEIDEAKVRQINKGFWPVYEPGLNGVLDKCVNSLNSLTAVTNINEMPESDVIFVSVGTHCESRNMTSYSNIVDVSKQIGHKIRDSYKFRIIVLRSSVVPGVSEEIIIPILEQYSSKVEGKDFGVVVNPEFLQEGRALDCFQNPDRIVIGTKLETAGDSLERLYREMGCSCPVVRTDTRTAEMIKYASNAFLATKISFINEIGNICKSLNIDTYDVSNGIGLDPRIGPNFLDAGIGFGGSCLPKDVKELISRAKILQYEPRLLQAVVDVNNDQPLKLIKRAEEYLGYLEGKTITVLGLAFKPNTDDIREAPALKTIGRLLEIGAIVKVFDPKVKPNALGTLRNHVYFGLSLNDAIAGSDCVMITTEWEDFTDPTIYDGKLVIDGRRVLDPRVSERKFQYEGIVW